MLEWLTDLDRELFLALNGFNGPFGDAVMVFLSKAWVWVPLYVAVIIWLFVRLGWRKGLVATAALALCFACCDQFSGILKDLVCRPRPCHDPALEGAVRLLENAGGQYGFPSAHAANCFGFALLSTLLVRRRWYGWVIFIWAAAVSYSRIYVGKHYPLDILAGVVLGLLLAWLFWLLARYLFKKFENLSGRDAGEVKSDRQA